MEKIGGNVEIPYHPIDAMFESPFFAVISTRNSKTFSTPQQNE